jgi:hypothetical protein
MTQGEWKIAHEQHVKLVRALMATLDRENPDLHLVLIAFAEVAAKFLPPDEPDRTAMSEVFIRYFHYIASGKAYSPQGARRKRSGPAARPRR